MLTETSVVDEKTVCELKNFLSKEFNAFGKPPAIVKRWNVDLDNEFEVLELAAPAIDLKRFAKAVDKTREAQSAAGCLKKEGSACAEECVLVFFKGFKGHYEKGASAIITRDVVEVSTVVPAALRKKLFRLLPECLATKKKREIKK